MIRYKQISDLFSGLEIPIEEYVYESELDITLPFATYIKVDNSNSFSADGIVYFEIFTVRLVLIDSTLDGPIKEEIERILTDNSIVYTASYDFDEEQRIFTTTYEFEAC